MAEHGSDSAIRMDTDYVFDDEHFTFTEIEDITRVKHNPKVFEGRYISLTLRDDGTLRPNFKMLATLADPAAVAVKGDVLKYLPRCTEQFTLIFADPPYALPQLSLLPDLVLSSGALADGGIFVLEHGKINDFSSHPCFMEHRAYGSVNFTFFSKAQ